MQGSALSGFLLTAGAWRALIGSRPVVLNLCDSWINWPEDTVPPVVLLPTLESSKVSAGS